jgi:threonine/homoserine/homoserine lactone efflux protein
MSLELYAAYLAACAVIVIVPGPSVTLIVANSLRHGARAGLLNVAAPSSGLPSSSPLWASGLLR